MRGNFKFSPDSEFESPVGKDHAGEQIDLVIYLPLSYD